MKISFIPFYFPSWAWYLLLTTMQERDACGQGGSKGPFLLKEVAPLGGLQEVDGIPRGQTGDQMAVRTRISIDIGMDIRNGAGVGAEVEGEKTRGGIVGWADLAASSNGQQDSLGEDKCQQDCPVVPACRLSGGGHRKLLTDPQRPFVTKDAISEVLPSSRWQLGTWQLSAGRTVEGRVPG